MSKIINIKDGFVIDKPGRVAFTPINPDGSLNFSGMIMNRALINSITVTNSKTKTDIADGNSFYPGGDRVTAIVGTVAIEFSTMDLGIYAMASGTEIKNEIAGRMLQFLEREISATNTIVIAGKHLINDALKIVGPDGTVFEKVESAPTEGEYSIESTDTEVTLTFAAGNAGKVVDIAIAMEKAVAKYSQGTSAMKAHRLEIQSTLSNIDEAIRQMINILISKVTISGDMVDSLQKDPSATKTLTFNMYKPRATEEPYTMLIEDIV